MCAVNDAANRREPDLPADPVCAVCGRSLAEPYGYCGNGRAAFCFPCGRAHFCLPSCGESGCLAGLCVRVVSGGVLSKTWGLPD